MLCNIRVQKTLVIPCLTSAINTYKTRRKFWTEKKKKLGLIYDRKSHVQKKKKKKRPVIQENNQKKPIKQKSKLKH